MMPRCMIARSEYNIMIFNSISKELNSNYQPRSHQSGAAYHPSGFYQPSHAYNRQNIAVNERGEMREGGSALSQMNQKIVSNLEYLKYKDHVRHSELRSSRVSNNSNRSYKSSRSKHSINSTSKSNILINSKHSNPLVSQVKTNSNQHYFPQPAFSKLEDKSWESKVSPLYQSYKPKYQQVHNSEFKEFLRKPITIEQYNQQYGVVKSEISRPQPDREPVERFYSKQSKLSSHDSSKYSDFQQEVKVQQINKQTPLYSTSREVPFNSQLKRSWAKSFGDSGFIDKPTDSRVSSKQSKLQNTPPPAETIPKQNAMQPMSPLAKPKQRNQGLIVAGALIILGLILFALQLAK